MVDFNKLIYSENEYVNQRNSIDVEVYNYGKWKRLRTDFVMDTELEELVALSKELNITDLEIAKKMSEVKCLAELSFEFAVDIKFWSALSLELFGKYILNKGVAKTNSEFSIKQSIYYVQSRGLISRHYLASVWWQMKLLEEAGKIDWESFERMNSLDSTTRNKLLESQIFRNPDNVQNFMKAILVLDKRYGKKFDSKVISNTISELNKLGGFIVLDIMDWEYYYSVLRDVKKRK